MKEQKELEYIKSHECNILKSDADIAIEKLSYHKGENWFFRYKNQLHMIEYCPYCGKQLLFKKEKINE